MLLEEMGHGPWVLLFKLVWVNGRQRATGSGRRATDSGRWAQVAGDEQQREMVVAAVVVVVSGLCCC